MSELPVREIVLYKHGVGFFVREGALSAAELTLPFRQDEINDVLKSLSVFDRAGGQVLGIHYPTPMDRDSRLSNSVIRLSHETSLHDLFRDLRGRQVSLTFERTLGTLETLNGRVIGLDEVGAEAAKRTLLTLLTESGKGEVLDLGTLRGFQIADDQSVHDMSYFLDTSLTEDIRRTVTVSLSPGDHQLVVSYVAPSPTWRVSYRVVAESDEAGQSGKALLQGWGLFDNRLDEDLENIQVTLVAGQPISFIYDLYASRIPERPTVQDETRIAPGPVEFAGGGVAAESTLVGFAQDLRFEAAPAAPQSPKVMSRLSRLRSEDFAKAAPPAATTKDTGETFQYVVTTPVSVKRGESALVPIIGAEVSYQCELLYNGAKLPDHPVAALRFPNSTGLTLERGPVTVVEDGDYKGEAVIAFTKEGNEVYLPYAVELGVRVVERSERRTETAGLSIENAYLIYDEYHVQGVVYTVENNTSKPQTVTIEARIWGDMELFDTVPPIMENATERRWRVDVPAHSKIEFRRQERLRSKRQESLRSVQYETLQHYLKHRWLDQSTFDRLSEILKARSVIEQARAEQNTLTSKRTAIYAQQEQLRANLGTLNAAGQEAALRNRMLSQLEAAQDQLEALDRRAKELEQEITTAEQQMEQIIAAFG